MSDPVEKPAHYRGGSIECIDAIRSALGDEAFVAYCRGNAMKYLWRAPHKGSGAEDILKAIQYLRFATNVQHGRPILDGVSR